MKKEYIFFSLIILVYLIFSIPKLNMSFSVEEEYFVMVAENINKGIGPVIRDGQEFKVFAVHPPLYIYLLSYSLKIFKDPELSARILSLMSILITGIILYFLSTRILKSKNYALLSMLIFYTSPYVIQSSVHVDINGSLLILFITLTFYLYSMNNKKINYFFIPLLLSIMLWSKLEGFILWIVSLFLYQLIRKRFKRAIYETGYFFISAMAIFSISWYIVASILNMNFFAPFYYIYDGFFSSTGYLGTEYLRKIFLYLWAFKNSILWIGLPLVVGVILFSYKLLKKEEDGGGDFLTLLVIYSWIIFTAFVIIPRTQFGFPKYSISLIPFFIIIFTVYLRDNDFFNQLKKNLLGVICCTLASIIILPAFGDPFIQNNIFYIKSIDLGKDFSIYLYSNIVTILFILILPSIIFVILYFFIKGDRENRLKNVLFLTLFVSFVTSSLYLDIVQAMADYSTTQGYGRRGMREAGEYIYSKTQDKDVILSDRDVGYYAKRNFYRVYPVTQSEIEDIKEIIRTNPSYFKVVAVSPSVDKTLVKLIKERCHNDRSFGVINVYNSCN